MENMDLSSFKGTTLYVGRESATDKLLVYTIDNGKIKSISLGQEGLVPHSVSRAVPIQQKAHISVAIDESGESTIKNLKPENITLVNGSPIITKRISAADKIELGTDHFNLPLELIFNSFSNKNSPSSTNQSQSNYQKEVKTYNISHLEKVWENYRKGLKEIKDKQKKINLVRSGCGIFTMCAMPTIFFLGPVGYILTGIGVLGNAYSFFGMKRNDPEEERERLTEILEQEYVCPNPDCKRYFGLMKYNLLKSQHHMSCPYCKSKFEEK